MSTEQADVKKFESKEAAVKWADEKLTEGKKLLLSFQKMREGEQQEEEDRPLFNILKDACHTFDLALEAASNHLSEKDTKLADFLISYGEANLEHGRLLGDAQILGGILEPADDEEEQESGEQPEEEQQQQEEEQQEEEQQQEEEEKSMEDGEEDDIADISESDKLLTSAIGAFIAARELLEEKIANSADVDFQQQLGQHQRRQTVSRLLAEAYLESNAFEQGITEFKKALEIETSFAADFSQKAEQRGDATKKHLLLVDAAQECAALHWQVAKAFASCAKWQDSLSSLIDAIDQMRSWWNLLLNKVDGVTPLPPLKYDDAVQQQETDGNQKLALKDDVQLRLPLDDVTAKLADNAELAAKLKSVAESCSLVADEVEDTVESLNDVNAESGDVRAMVQEQMKVLMQVMAGNGIDLGAAGSDDEEDDSEVVEVVTKKRTQPTPAEAGDDAAQEPAAKRQKTAGAA